MLAWLGVLYWSRLCLKRCHTNQSKIMVQRKPKAIAAKAITTPMASSNSSSAWSGSWKRTSLPQGPADYTNSNGGDDDDDAELELVNPKLRAMTMTPKYKQRMLAALTGVRPNTASSGIALGKAVAASDAVAMSSTVSPVRSPGHPVITPEVEIWRRGVPHSQQTGLVMSARPHHPSLIIQPNARHATCLCRSLCTPGSLAEECCTHCTACRRPSSNAAPWCSSLVPCQAAQEAGSSSGQSTTTTTSSAATQSRATLPEPHKHTPRATIARRSSTPQAQCAL